MPKLNSLLLLHLLLFNLHDRTFKNISMIFQDPDTVNHSGN